MTLCVAHNCGLKFDINLSTQILGDLTRRESG